MFSLNIFNNPEPLSIYLVKVDGTIIGSLDNIIDKSTATLNISLNKQYELNFDIVKRYDDKENWYEYIHEGMYLFVDRVGLFKMEQPAIENDLLKEKKTIRAFSIDIELESKKFSLPINTGLKTSMEYCVQYDANETEELLNPYTGIPYDWIVIYNTYPEQLTEWKTKLNNISTLGVEGWDIDSDNNFYTEDSDEIEKVTNLLNLIPRLKSKITYADNPDGSKDSIITDYIDITYNNNEEITRYTLFTTFINRIDELIIFYTKYRNQLGILSLVLDNMGGNWTVGNVYGVDDGDYTLANKRYKFSDFNGTDYAFLTQNLASTAKCIISFDVINRKVNITPIENIGEDTGIIVGYDTLINTLNISTDEDSIATRLYVQGSDELGISRANFGTNYVDDLSYKLNVRSDDGKRIYASDALAEKYNNFITYREQQREIYIELSKEYDEYTKQISEIENRVPNDNLKNDWSTFSMDELTASLTSFKNLLATLQMLYKHDYGEAGLNQDGSINEDFIKNTMYWWDYDAYKSIITEINCAIDVYPYYGDQTQWTLAQIREWRAKIKEWETDWTLYGTVELNAKIDIYKQNMELMIEEQETLSDIEAKSIVIRKYAPGTEPTPEDAWTIKTWNELTDTEKAGYGGSSILYRYDDYMEFYNNSISAKEYLDTLLEEVEDIKDAQNLVQTQRTAITENVQFESYFTADECKVLYRIIKDSDYTNENIVSTSLDSPSERIEVMRELLEDAKDKVSERSRPQLIFNVQADNLLALPDFQCFWDSFYPGNYMLVQYKDNTYVKLRMIGFTFNPCIPSSNTLEIEFSNFLRSRAYYNDWAFFFEDQSKGSGSSGNGSSSGGSSGEGGYGQSDDIDITISNTMLAKMLNTELFGSRVTNVVLDTMDLNALYSKTATFGSLANGTTKVDGKCITTGYIKDIYYNGTNGAIDNTLGSIINLETGRFSFGGGKLKFDGADLYADGEIHARSGTFGADSYFTIGATGLEGTYTYTPTDPTEYQIFTNNSVLTGDYTVDEPIISFNIIQETTESDYDNHLVIFPIDNPNISFAELQVNILYTENTIERVYEYDNQTHERGQLISEDLTDNVYDYSMSIPTSSGNNFNSSYIHSGILTTYTISYEFPYTGLNFKSYLINEIWNQLDLRDSSTTSTNVVVDVDGSAKEYEYIVNTSVVITNLSVSTTVNYAFSEIKSFAHIGSDFFEYSNLISTRNNTLTVNDIHINGALYANKDIIGNDWGITYGVDNFLIYTNNTTAGSSEGMPIYIKQYINGSPSLLNTATILDKNGKTKLPIELIVPSISSANETLDIKTPVTFYGTTNYIGKTNNKNQRQFLFNNLDSGGQYLHNCQLYGGNANSKTAIGMWDLRNNRGILVYQDVDNGTLYLDGSKNIWVRDWNNGSRRPCCSGTQTQTRVAYVYCNASNFCVNGQHGTDNYSTKRITMSTSDIRLKKNIRNTEVISALDLINNIKIRSFDWIDREEDYHRKIGFVADELEQLDNKLVVGGGYDSDGCMDVKGVDTFYLLGYVVKAIQEMYERLIIIEEETNKN